MKIIKILIIGLFLLNNIYASEEIPSKEEVAKLYIATFNRAPDTPGLGYWITASGLKLSQIAQSFFDQGETRAFYPEGTSNLDFVTSVYQNLFNREPDTAGLNYWEKELGSNKLSRNRFIEAVINSAQNTDISNDVDILNNKIIVSLSFAEAGFIETSDARTIMENITEDSSSVDSALNRIELAKSDGPPIGVDFTNTDLNVSVLKSGYLDVNESVEKKFQLVYDQEKFNEVYKTFDNNTTPEVDFLKNYVAVLELGKKTSKNYSAKVTKIRETYHYRTIFVETTILDKNCPTEVETVVPFEIVSFPIQYQQYRETLFEESIKVIKCDEEETSDVFDTFSFREIELRDYNALIYTEVSYTMGQTLQVIQDAKVYEDIYYNHINPVGMDKELPYIDFQNETFLALFLRQYGSTGYNTTVKSMKEYTNYIEVEIQRDMPGNYCAVGAAITAPATLIVLPKTEKEIIFKENANVKICEQYRGQI